MGYTSENKTFWTKHVQYTWQEFIPRTDKKSQTVTRTINGELGPLVSVTRRKMLTWARGVENVGKQTLSELMERFVLQVA